MIFFNRKKGKDIQVYGAEGNKVRIDSSARLCNVKIVFMNCEDGEVLIDRYCELAHVSFLVMGNKSKIEIGSGTMINAHERMMTVLNAVDASIRIGAGCLLSEGIELHTTDYHGIYDGDGMRINHEANIVLGNHVWIGMRALIMKGSFLADGSIVGAGSIVTGNFEEQNTAIAGVPAKVIRHGCVWDHARKDRMDQE